ncbi:tellurite resistance protein [Vibrio ponticus]|nr:tellurite resistance protein [Vibrio ponticus]
MNWRRLTQFQGVPPSQAALALGIIGLGQAWALYVPAVGEAIRPFMAGLGALLLAPVLIKYLSNPKIFVADLRHPLSGSLMAPMSMALLILCDYLAVISPIIATRSGLLRSGCILR